MHALCSAGEFGCLQIRRTLERLLQHSYWRKERNQNLLRHGVGTLLHRRHAHRLFAERHQHNKDERRHSEESACEISLVHEYLKVTFFILCGAALCRPTFVCAVNGTGQSQENYIGCRKNYIGRRKNYV